MYLNVEKVINILINCQYRETEVLFDRTSSWRFPSPTLLATTPSMSSCDIRGLNSSEPGAKTMRLLVLVSLTSGELQTIVGILGRCRTLGSSQCVQ